MTRRGLLGSLLALAVAPRALRAPAALPEVQGPIFQSVVAAVSDEFAFYMPAASPLRTLTKKLGRAHARSIERVMWLGQR